MPPVRPHRTQETVLAAIEAARQIVLGHGMGVIPASAGGLGFESVGRRVSRHDHGRPLFHGAIHRRRNFQSVPVDEFGNIGIVDNSDRDPLTLAQPNQRTRRGSVVTDCLNDLARSDLHRHGCNTQRVVRMRRRSG
jgi:hypothetical protein